jgi:hypothetical protein
MTTISHRGGDARRWWTITLVIAFAAVGATQFSVPSRLQSAARVVRAEIPSDWRALPVTARLQGDAVTGSDGDFLGYDTTVRHTGQLGRFSVTWGVWLYKGIGAGNTPWSISAPDLLGSYPPASEAQTVGSAPPYPEALREGEGGVLVLEGRGSPLGAFRLAPVITASPTTASARLALAAFTLAGVLLLSFISRGVSRWPSPR